MRTIQHCLKCTINQDKTFFDRFLPELPPERVEEHFRWLREEIFRLGMSSVELGTIQHRRRHELAEELGKNKDVFKKIKERSHQLASEIVSRIHVDTLDDRIRAAVAGNRIDYGRVKFPDLNTLMNDVYRIIRFGKLTINDTLYLHSALKNAKTVMYIVDNAGEADFDRFLLEYCSERVGRDNMYIVARGESIINDITVDEMHEQGFDKYGQILSVGKLQVGVIMNRATDEFKKTLEYVDLVIPKGMATYESLTEYPENPGKEKRFHIFIAKCPAVVDSLSSLGVKLWSNIVLFSDRYSEGYQSRKPGICLHDTPECAHRTKIYG